MIYLDQNHIFIDPIECGSSVGYHLGIERATPSNKPPYHYIQGTVVLADCTHKIDWTFGDDSLDKIDAAIHMLKEFRKKYTDAQRRVELFNKGGK